MSVECDGKIRRLLAAAAYNAGPGRVREWLAGRRGLPRETRAYVSLVTGQSAEQWTGVQVGHAEMHVANAVPCQRIADLLLVRRRRP